MSVCRDSLENVRPCVKMHPGLDSHHRVSAQRGSADYFPRVRALHKHVTLGTCVLFALVVDSEAFSPAVGAGAPRVSWLWPTSRQGETLQEISLCRTGNRKRAIAGSSLATVALSEGNTDRVLARLMESAEKSTDSILQETLPFSNPMDWELPFVPSAVVSMYPIRNLRLKQLHFLPLSAGALAFCTCAFRRVHCPTIPITLMTAVLQTRRALAFGPSSSSQRIPVFFKSPLALPVRLFSLFSAMVVLWYLPASAVTQPVCGCTLETWGQCA